MGGFHLGPKLFHDRIDPVIKMLLDFEPAVVAPAHCTGYRAAYDVYQRRARRLRAEHRRYPDHHGSGLTDGVHVPLG